MSDYEFHTKICTKCNVEQHVYFFQFDIHKGRYASWCQYCVANIVINKARTKELQGNKFCPGCGETKPLSEYRLDTKTQGYYRKCKACNSKRGCELHIKHRYGVDAAWREETLMAQDNKCAICKISLNDTNFKPHIDHDASNGKVRAILCPVCNMLMGIHQENCTTLRAAGFDRHAEYIEYHKRIHEIKLVG